MKKEKQEMLRDVLDKLTDEDPQVDVAKLIHSLAMTHTTQMSSAYEAMLDRQEKQQRQFRAEIMAFAMNRIVRADAQQLSRQQNEEAARLSKVDPLAAASTKAAVPSEPQPAEGSAAFSAREFDVAEVASSDERQDSIMAGHIPMPKH